MNFGHSPKELTQLKSDISATRMALSTAKRIVFLGFAFHRQNIELLFPGQGHHELMRSCSVYATAHCISSADVDVIKEELINKAGKHLPMAIRNDLKCSQLFSEFWRSLSLQ